MTVASRLPCSPSLMSAADYSASAKDGAALLKSPHGEPGERRRRVMFVEIQFPKTPSSVRSGIKSRKPILPCRSSGARTV